jgi:hypothetical protein
MGMILELVLLCVATFFLAFSLTQGDTDWKSQGGQEHHPIGNGLVLYGIIGMVLIAVTILVGLFIPVSFTVLPPYGCTILFALIVGMFFQALL